MTTRSYQPLEVITFSFLFFLLPLLSSRASKSSSVSKPAIILDDCLSEDVLQSLGVKWRLLLSPLKYSLFSPLNLQRTTRESKKRISLTRYLRPICFSRKNCFFNPRGKTAFFFFFSRKCRATDASVCACVSQYIMSHERCRRPCVCVRAYVHRRFRVKD